MTAHLTIEQWPLERVIPYSKNARIIPQSAIEKVALSIQQFGFRQPIVVDSKGVIIAGHTRLLAAKHLGLLDVPIHVGSDLSAQQAKAYRLMDNRSHEETSWDFDILHDALAEISSSQIEFTGFDAKELDKYLNPPKPGLTDENDVPEVPVTPVTETGDLWILGKHRVLCGDSTNQAHVARLLAGNAADMVFTDPPYGVAVCGGTHDSRDKANYGKGPRIANDEIDDSKLLPFLADAFGKLANVVKAGAAIYVTHADTKGTIFREAFAQAGFKLHCVCIWVKQQFVFGRSDYHWQHEPILYGWLATGSHSFYGGRDQSTIWAIDRPMRSEKEHPTQKPVALAAKAVENSSKAGDIILDTFGGTGSTLIACEQSSRECRLMEITPRYVDVIVERWQNFTGKEAYREDTGETFNSAKQARSH